MTTVQQDNDNRRLEQLEVRMAAMEARMDASVASITDLRAEFRALHVEVKENQRETNRRIDRLFYALIGIGGGIIAALVVMIIRGNPVG